MTTINFKVNVPETVTRLGVTFDCIVNGPTVTLQHGGKSVMDLVVKQDGDYRRSKGSDFYKVGKHIQQQADRVEVPVTVEACEPIVLTNVAKVQVSSELADAEADMSEVRLR